ncbi:MerR family transcriptional regulator [Companilactobacillus nuruki]|uniref:MerR family transcriptional regulator n=1 Tax=Companilactobacillus nuruki TaxID=1993540 RepID=A0A2N7AWI6_9LACO|nr:MerR family transcriptional regulator [Companilactobacillus nuruki]PMD73092.1 MerR family transcriptional regulator [Companilactobacillus nuruki]
MKISDVSKKVGLPVATIRYYSDLEMIPSLKRDTDGQRIFDDEAIVWLEGIKFQRDLGMSLAEIKKFIELSQDPSTAALKKRHQILLEQRIKANQRMLSSADTLKRIDLKIKLDEDIIAKKKRDSLSAARRFSL